MITSCSAASSLASLSKASRWASSSEKVFLDGSAGAAGEAGAGAEQEERESRDVLESRPQTL